MHMENIYRCKSHSIKLIFNLHRSFKNNSVIAFNYCNAKQSSKQSTQFDADHHPVVTTLGSIGHPQIAVT